MEIKAETMDIEVDTMEATDKDEMISIVEAAEADTTIKEDALGMETEIKVKMNEEIIMTIITIARTEISMKTQSNRQILSRLTKFLDRSESENM